MKLFATLSKVIAGALGIVAVIVLLYTLAFGATYIGIEWRGFFGARRAIVERNIYEESPSFVQGKILDLSRHHHEWRKADAEEKVALEYLIRQQMVQLNPDNIRDTDLRAWYNSIK